MSLIDHNDKNIFANFLKGAMEGDAFAMNYVWQHYL